MINKSEQKKADWPKEKLTLTRCGVRSGAAWIASEPQEAQQTFLESLTEDELRALPFLWDFWAFEHQMPPDGDWRSWVIMGGRGAGKTRAGAEWVRSEVEGATPLGKGRSKAVALIGETFDQVREVMVFGDSGILACSPPDRRPEWQATRRRLVWPNGAVAWAFSAQEPEALRGPQFDAAWVDEIAKWRKAGDVWDMLQFALRLGNSPRQVVTTTPRNEPTLKRILGMPTTVVTTAPTEANRANLAGSFLEEVRARYAGTRLGRQELDGVLLEDTQGALWSHASLEAIGVDILPELDRVVVAVDPPASSDGDDCGIVVAGAITKGPPSTWQAYVLQDATVIGQTPLGWAKAAVDALEANGADRLVAEINQGGAMVETIVRQVDPLVSYRGVHASRGKVARAEPVAALYEQGRVYHARGLGSLEDQMTQMTTQGFAGQGSPDRVDALVWALTDLMIEPARKFQEPRMRTL